MDQEVEMTLTTPPDSTRKNVSRPADKKTTLDPNSPTPSDLILFLQTNSV
jgi:hypothetical protein